MLGFGLPDIMGFRQEAYGNLGLFEACDLVLRAKEGLWGLHRAYGFSGTV